MNTFCQHIPGAVETEDPPFRFDFATADELLAHPWIKKWQEHPEFYRYSISLDTGTSRLLMAEFAEGKRWWVLGYLRHLQGLSDMPIWKAPEK